MNRIDERRRALLSSGDNKFWIYKEGEAALEPGFTLSGQCCYVSGGKIVTIIDSSTSAFFGIGVDFTGYSKLSIEAMMYIVKGPGTARVGYSGNYVNITTTRQIYEFDIANINGVRSVGGDAKRQYSSGNISNYVYNIWLE